MARACLVEGQLSCFVAVANDVRAGSMRYPYHEAHRVERRIKFVSRMSWRLLSLVMAANVKDE